MSHVGIQGKTMQCTEDRGLLTCSGNREPSGNEKASDQIEGRCVRTAWLQQGVPWGTLQGFEQRLAGSSIGYNRNHFDLLQADWSAQGWGRAGVEAGTPAKKLSQESMQDIWTQGDSSGDDKKVPSLNISKILSFPLRSFSLFSAQRLFYRLNVSKPCS